MGLNTADGKRGSEVMSLRILRHRVRRDVVRGQRPDGLPLSDLDPRSCDIRTTRQDQGVYPLNSTDVTVYLERFKT